MVTVAFDLQHQSTENRLRDCSTDPDKHFFIAEDDDELAQAFQEIRAQVQEAMYISK